MMRSNYLLSLIFIVALAGSCEKQGLDGLNSLVKIDTEPVGENCANGGYKISSGLDLNNDNILNTNEVQSISFLCHGINNNLDKKIIVPFIGRNGVQGSSSSGTVVSEQVIHGFNINDYPEADSVVFGGFQWSLEEGIECSVELYDLTNEKVIEDTQIKAFATGSTTKWTATTKNFIDHLPEEAIDLGVFIKSSQEGERVYITALTLIVYRY